MNLIAIKRKRYRLKQLGIMLLAIAPWAYAQSQTLPHSVDFDQLVSRCAPDVSPVTMHYLVNIESAYQPFSLNINRRSHSQTLNFNDALSAIAMANKLIQQGENIDMGLGQINSITMQRLGLSVAEIYDPCTNLTTSAEVLKQCYTRALRTYPSGQIALTHALSCYNTGNFKRGLTNGYVAKLQKLAAHHQEIVPELTTEHSEVSTHSASETLAVTVSQYGERDAFSQAGNEDAFNQKIN